LIYNFKTVIEFIPELIKDVYVEKYTAGKMCKGMIALHSVAAGNPELRKYRRPIAA
jgi:hypothetical protein